VRLTLISVNKLYYLATVNFKHNYT